MRNRTLKVIASFLLVNLLYEIFFPAIAFALTSGPSQPEVQSFEPVGTSELVNVSTGDMVYNIPLLDVEGFPINISYHSGIMMDQEASWVGLGWNINPGSIVRNMRGLPDDFLMDPVRKRNNIKKNETYGLRGSVGFEFSGWGSLSTGIGITTNNYRGTSLDFFVHPTLGIGLTTRTDLNIGLGVSLSSSEGISLSPSLSLESEQKSEIRNKTSIGISGKYNSSSGFSEVSLDQSAKLINEKTGKFSKGGNSVGFSFAGNTYVPQYMMAMESFAFNLSIKPGGEAFAAHPNFGLSGFYSGQYLAEREATMPAIGYMYMENATATSLLDFNREKDLPYKPDKTDLPITNITHDAFSFSGEGTGGVFRTHRGDIGILHDPYVENKSLSGDVGFDVGFGAVVKVGVNAMATFVNSNSGPWDKNNLLPAIIPFQERTAGSLYEPYFMKNNGEKSVVSDETFYNKIGGNDLVYIPINSLLSPETKFKKQNSSFVNLLSGLNHRSKREKRNQVISTLTAKEAEVAGLNKFIESYPLGSKYMPSGELSEPIDVQPRNAGNRKQHHLSEISVLNSDGRRYVYGLPAYNTLQVEATFAVGTNSPIDNLFGADSSKALNDIVTYAQSDNTIHNTKGVDNYFSSTELPPYAHSFLLTGVVSPDYIDITGNGITDDDLGGYTRLNYTKVYPTPAGRGYKWRTPYGKTAREAQFEEGARPVSTDNKASYVYGEKEVWYVHSIESKNYIAEFIIDDDRKDTKEAYNEDGGVGERSLYRLKKINLYLKSERLRHGDNAQPIKTVHFEYSYELCKGVYNNGEYNVEESGKLTLKKIYFTSGKSHKGYRYPYVFKYGENLNPNYSSKDVDRWGNYKQNTAGNPAKDNPYTGLDSVRVNTNSNAWTLDKIYLPTGGLISFEYEADDYAYVQDRKAMNMFTLTGISRNTTYNNLTEIDNSNADNNYFFFSIPKSIPTSASTIRNDLFRDRFLKDETGKIPKVFYFKIMVGVIKTNKSSGALKYDFVPGYAEIDSYGINSADHSGGYYTRGYIRFKKVRIGDRENGGDFCSPISKASWQFARLNLSDMISGVNANGGIVDAIKNLVNVANSVSFMFKGYNRTLENWGWGKDIALSKSFIRLYNPNKIKYGGGVRVKTVKLNDQWNEMGSGTSSFDYGLKYTYRKTEKQTNGETLLISSGVASYEPMIGNDENPFRMPIYSNEHNLLAPDNKHYVETPTGESYFPGPNVTYSYIKIENIVQNSGYEEYEFYTTKDFPTITKNTNAEVKNNNPAPKLATFLEVNVVELVAVSQGYLVENNDMDGKAKSHWVYGEDGKPISGVVYEYQTDPTNPKLLNNMASVVDEHGVIQTKEIGKEIDISVDMRQSENTTSGVGHMANGDAFFLFIFPVVLPSWFPSLANENIRFNSVVTTKTINRFGLLKKVTYYNENSVVSTTNDLYDSETGNVIMTSTQNEFKDPVYDLNYPAYWAYDGMGLAFQNIGFEKELNITNGLATVSNAKDFYVEGDELWIYNDSGYSKMAWITKRAGNNIFMVDRNGYAIETGTYVAKVIRSGRRNMQDISAGSVRVLTKPTSLSSFTNVLNASATTFSDSWGILQSDTIFEKNYRTCDRCVLTKYSSDLMDLLNYLAIKRKLTSVRTIGTGYTGPGAVPIHLNSTYANSDLYKLIDNNQVPNTFYATGHYYSLGTDPDPINSHVMYPVIAAPYIGMSGDFDLCQITITKPADTAYKFRNILSFSNPRVKDLSASPDSSGEYYLDAEFLYQDSIKVMQTLVVSTNCALMARCYSEDIDDPTYCIVSVSGDTIINPYQTGMKGSWRVKSTYQYRDLRTQNTTPGVTNVRKDGVFATFSPFWTMNSTGKMTPNEGTKWVKVNEVTEYDPFGHELENRDAIGRYSSAVYGFNHNVPIAVASNARYRQIGFDGFEDYNLKTNASCASCLAISHFNFKSQLINDNALNETNSHTGNTSLQIGEGDSIQMIFYSNNSSVNKYTDTLLLDETIIHKNNLIGVYEPMDGKNILSYWVKSDAEINAKSALKVLAYNSGASLLTMVNSVSVGDKIEGWRKVDVSFEIPSGTANVVIRMVNPTEGAVYFDDLRVYPAAATMKSYVYDYTSMRLMAELDENNYATFYEYDEDGALIRVKKETERGIMTIKESRKKNSNNSHFNAED